MLAVIPMNWTSQRFVVFTFLTLSCHGASAQSAIEEYGTPIESLPSVVNFDCAFERGVEPISVGALGTKLRVPKTFEVQDDDALWLNRNVLLKADDGQLFEVSLVSIHIGTYEIESVSSFFGEFETIAGPETNNLNATIIQRLPQPQDFSGQHWLFMLKGTNFLKIVSYDPVNWGSLLPCFQP